MYELCLSFDKGLEGVAWNCDKVDGIDCCWFPNILNWFWKRRGSEFSSYEIELRNQVLQNDVTLQVTNSKIFIERLLLSY